MIGAADYALGSAELIASVAAALLGAGRLRSRLLPGWSGPPAWLATGVLGVSLLLILAQLLGAFGLFEAAPYFIACVAAGLALWRFLPAPADGDDAPPAPAPSRAELLIAFGVIALLIAHWSLRVRLSFEQGMTGYDTVWYHEPFAAHFAQSGSTWALDFISPRYLVWFYPANSELTHGIGLLAFHRDLLSPLFNLLWLGGALLAAWCIGRPYRGGAISVLAVGVLLDSGLMADQAGSGRNDVIALFFLLAACAVLVNAAAAAGAGKGWILPSGALLVAGLATGLAAGVKLTGIPPALVLALGVALIAPAGRRWRALAWFGLPALAAGGFWYLRNLVQAGNPLPWVKSIGPLSLPSPSQGLNGRQQFSIAHYLGDTSVIKHWFLAGLHDALGVLWPLIGVLALVGLLLALTRGNPVLRVIGLAGLSLVVVWLLQGASAEGPPGRPVGFTSSLRHLAPALAIGLSLGGVLELWPGRGRRAAGWVGLALLLVLLLTADASGEPWRPGFVAAAVLLGVGSFVVLAGCAEALAGRLPRRPVAAALAGLVLIVVAIGLPAARRYLDHRYTNTRFTPAGLNRAFIWANSLHDKRIAVVATRTYPLYGNDLSNRVVYIGAHRAEGGWVDVRSCRSWRRRLDRGDFDYAVISEDRVGRGAPAFLPQVGWTAAGSGASLIFAQSPTAVFRIDGSLDPAACAAPSHHKPAPVRRHTGRSPG